MARREFLVRAEYDRGGGPTFTIGYYHPDHSFVECGYADTREEADEMRDNAQEREDVLTGHARKA